MHQQIACFRDHRGITVEGRISFAGGFSRGVMLRRHIGNGEPLGLTVYSIKRLITCVRQFQKTIRALLNGRSSKRERWNQEEKREKCSAMHGRSLTEITQRCEARSLVGTDRYDVRKIYPAPAWPLVA